MSVSISIPAPQCGYCGGEVTLRESAIANHVDFTCDDCTATGHVALIGVTDAKTAPVARG